MITKALKAKGQYPKSSPTTEWDKFGRSGYMQVVHIDVWYEDGTKGEINLTSPQIVWGEDVDHQYNAMRDYLKSQHKRLGIVKYQGHCYTNINGILKKAFSYQAFDLHLNKTIDL